MYRNFYFRKLQYDDQFYCGEFSDPDDDVYCEFRYNRMTEQCEIWNNNRTVNEILPLPIWWLDKKMRQNGKLEERENRVCW